MSRIEQIRKTWRDTNHISGADVEFILKLSELPPNMESARKRVMDDLHMAICCGPLMHVEDRIRAAIERSIHRLTAAIRGQDYETVDGKALEIGGQNERTR